MGASRNELKQRFRRQRTRSVKDKRAAKLDARLHSRAAGEFSAFSTVFAFPSARPSKIHLWRLAEWRWIAYHGSTGFADAVPTRDNRPFTCASEPESEDQGRRDGRR